MPDRSATLSQPRTGAATVPGRRPPSWPRQGEWTHADWLGLPNDDGWRYEIVRGSLYMSPAPRSQHQIVASNLGHAFQVFVRRRKLGLVLFAPLDVYLPGEATPVEPDIVIVRQEQMDMVIERGIEGAPALLVEILSPSTRWKDLEVKRPLYAECGVAELWIVDAEAGEILVHAQPGSDTESGAPTPDEGGEATDIPTLPSGNWRIVGRYTAGQRARSLVLKGFSVAVDAVMAGGG